MTRITAEAQAVLWSDRAAGAPDGLRQAPLTSSRSADVCIVGGGFTGLWTALEIKQQNPAVSVVLLEATTCGAGASGRNGGWATGWFDELPELIEHFGVQQALWLAEESSQAVARIGQTAEEFGFDAHVRQSGALWTATSPSQLGSWDRAVEACARYGRPEMLELLTGDEVRRRTGSPLPLAAARHTDAASVHPYRLVQGLLKAVLSLGVEVYEATPMQGFTRGTPVTVQTPMAVVEAAQVVLATGVWAAALPELRRAIVPAASHVIATEPLAAKDLGEWADGSLFGDARLQVHYAQVTRDGRIVFGKGGGAVGAFGRVVPAHYWDEDSVRRVHADFVTHFPHLAGARITHSWGGAVDRAPHHMPFVGTVDGAGNIHYGVGYSGNGVAPSALIGRILGRRAVGVVDDYTACALVSGPPAYLPPDPIRYVGGRMVQAGIGRAEAAEAAGRRPDPISALLRRLLWTTTPRWAEPRLLRRKNRAHGG
jgi:glycine/D-amino acid oxidase-like deaminating enzyme